MCTRVCRTRLRSRFMRTVHAVCGSRLTVLSRCQDDSERRASLSLVRHGMRARMPGGSFRCAGDFGAANACRPEREDVTSHIQRNASPYLLSIPRIAFCLRMPLCRSRHRLLLFPPSSPPSFLLLYRKPLTICGFMRRRGRWDPRVSSKWFSSFDSRRINSSYLRA